MRSGLAVTRFPFTTGIQGALLSNVATIMPASLYGEFIDCPFAQFDSALLEASGFNGQE